mmetsp:Transcript_20534/g.28809  ORF Transcript_20534/g.28809 Transcript_20534/m.28809 type:complete len:290 (+) Transcript_20534:260-1129(+)|eukprot:CAMPEP_0168548340 /NCGR_PEP_ID=MMETSP0413-20121227/4507_1 /TAXON_ID=136452 /ORGANISM="Filamoeba nolandi, Strain NC-AS-23-1" /LENGTH=289 /DNA_ID=CAMNT_0008578633 /DNA_START=153 /DNA_END=1022 /DNA_ORIENTATION=-
MAEFFIERQESLAQDRFTKNGVCKELHLVAKCIPFTLHVCSTIDLNQTAIQAKLYYDSNSDSAGKEVETLKGAPLDSVAHVNSMGNKAAVEVRVSVLSSQHEGAFFRIKLTATDPESGETLEAVSQPIKVISKRNQVRKMIERNELSREDNPHIQVSPLPPSPPQNKRSLSAASLPSADSIQETLLRLEEQQRQQAQLLQQLCAQRNPFDLGSIPDTDFESAFAKFLLAFQKTPATERASKMRRVMETHSQPLNDFLDVANAETARSFPDSLMMQSLLAMPCEGSDALG